MRGSEANFGFGRALMTSYLGMHPPKAAFSDAATHTLLSLVLLLADISKHIHVSCVFFLPCLAFVFLT